MDGFRSVHTYENGIALSVDDLGKEQLYYNVDTLKYSISINDLITSNEKDKIYFSNILKFGYNYDDRTPYKNIKRVLPGETVYLNNDKHIFKEKTYTFKGIKEDTDLNQLLTHNIKKCLDSIPRDEEKIGVLLSGGIDSSIVSAILIKLKEEKYFPQDLQFYSINNGEDTKYIEIFEKRYNISTKKLNYNPSELTDDEVKEILKVNETPVDLGSMIPNYLIFKQLNEEGIRYVFTGDGPDELFGGYKRMDEYDSQLSDIFYELAFYHYPRLNKASRHFGLELQCPWCHDNIVSFAITRDFEDRLHKKVLKDTFKDIIPEEIINRQKNPLKNDLVRENKQEYRNKMVKLFYEIMGDQDESRNN